MLHHSKHCWNIVIHRNNNRIIKCQTNFLNLTYVPQHPKVTPEIGALISPQNYSKYCISSFYHKPQMALSCDRTNHGLTGLGEWTCTMAVRVSVPDTRVNHLASDAHTLCHGCEAAANYQIETGLTLSERSSVSIIHIH